MQPRFIAELLTWLENVENEIRTDAYVIFALVALQIVRRCCSTLYMLCVWGGVWGGVWGVCVCVCDGVFFFFFFFIKFI